MTTAVQIPVDPLATLANTETQRLAARMAQDAFAAAFRMAVSPDGEAGELGELAGRCYNWSQAGADEEARALRLALLVAGLDAWGLAYTQAFHLNAIPALTALIGGLRTRLDATADARFLQQFSTLADNEFAAVDFKVELRRSIHLALWHAMAACETAEQAEGLVRPLGSLLLGLNEQMPELGWRLIADALASIQISLLADPAASARAQEGTQQLFAALRHALPGERYQAILAHSGQAVVAWQQARRARDAEGRIDA
ncbi:hypothetical protein BJN45_02570 [Azonexus hydrophilus]|uniref:Uncharacterized protein n=1 Tax=Azonexus hydrophilus TaxID=418702 RepID=A0A1R1ID67_9RHOO|nr:hypothetical protein [Azonexus hydrophilus]OMG56519.1 hypothetical protein BJN45_02570 [Azonexus hydrophilus]